MSSGMTAGILSFFGAKIEARGGDQRRERTAAGKPQKEEIHHDAGGILQDPALVLGSRI
jgi:hypothetical protein